MRVSLGQKLLVGLVGIGFALFVLLFFPWWLALLGLFAMVPFFAKVLTA